MKLTWIFSIYKGSHSILIAFSSFKHSCENVVIISFNVKIDETKR